MYFAKARKGVEEQSANRQSEKTKRDRYQRTDSPRLVLQALPQQQPQSSTKGDQSNDPKLSRLTSNLSPVSPSTSKFSQATVFRDEISAQELPDGACFRPKKDLKPIPAASSAASSAANSTSGSSAPSKSGSSSHSSREDTGIDKEPEERVYPAEYVGTFSVHGSDKEARERRMESQLEQIRDAKERKPVSLILSNSGIRVVLQENNNILMGHSLKRIWYATCDPEYCQFSFLAREPKTSADVQYCHAFVTRTPEEAEDLIADIGEAFKTTYEESKKQLTFHELIERQVQQQQAHFREIEKEAKSALQQKLAEIATPTPFSERAQQRMEQRRRSDDSPQSPTSERIWAKQKIEQHVVKHALSPERSRNSAAASSSRQEAATRLPQAQLSPLQRNFIAPQVLEHVSQDSLHSE